MFQNRERSSSTLGKIRGTSIYIRKDSTDTEPATILFNGPNRLQIQCKVSVIQGQTKGDFIVTINMTDRKVTPVEREDDYTFPTVEEHIFRVNEYSSYSRRLSEPRWNGYTVPEYFTRVFEKILKSKSYRKTRRIQQGLRVPEENSGTQEPFKIRKLFDAIGRTPPIKAHCVARAMQLLDVNAIRGQIGEKTFSSACRTKFAYQRDGSLPTPGGDITKETGIDALLRLFYESLPGSIPAIVNTAEYDNFKQILKGLFEGEKAPVGERPTAEEEEEEEGETQRGGGLALDRSRPAFCGSGDSRIQIPRELAYKLRSVSNSLLQQQKQHIGVALNLIFKLFDRDEIQRNRRFAMSRLIIEGGMEAINRIAVEARTVLLQYYKGCEGTYRQGVQEIYAYNQKVPLTLSQVNGTVSRSSRTRRNRDVEDDSDNDYDENDNNDRDRRIPFDRYGRPQTPWQRR